MQFYAANMVAALAEIHSRGIIHRDVKLENFMVDSDGYLRLGDFGSAKDDMHKR